MKTSLLTLSKLVIGLCLLFTLYLCFYQLGRSPLENWDEAWFADVTRTILRTGEFIKLSWNGEIWLDKPPLYMWISALFSVFGVTEFSVRLLSALSGSIIIGIVLLYSFRNFGILPALLGFSTLALNNVFLFRTRSGNIDVFVTLLIFLTYFLILSKNKYKYPFLGLLFGLIFLTKASLVVFPLIIFGLHETVFELKNIRKNFLEYIKLVLIFVSICGAWLYAGYLKIGPDFYEYFLFKSDQGVASLDLSKFQKDYIDYAYYSLQRRFYWVFLIGAIFAVFSIRKPQYFLLLPFAFGLLFQLSFTERSNNWYLIPSMPFWSLLVAFGTYKIIKLSRDNMFVIAGVILLSGYVSYRTFTINILPILDNVSALKQAQSSKELNKLSQKNDTVVRLDHLYPTTVYYTDRHVLSSPEGNTVSSGWWISRENLIKSIRAGQIKWIVGVKKDVEKFKNEAASTQFNLIPVNDEEIIMEVL